MVNFFGETLPNFSVCAYRGRQTPEKHLSVAIIQPESPVNFNNIQYE